MSTNVNVRWVHGSFNVNVDIFQKMLLFQRGGNILLIPALTIKRKFKKYSGGQLKRDGKNVSFCVLETIEIMKTNNVPVKSPIKLLPKMKKIFLKCSKFLGFRDLF